MRLLLMLLGPANPHVRVILPLRLVADAAELEGLRGARQTHEGGV